METIKNYLDTMFMNLPKTSEVIRAKDELLTMMEDKYNELKSDGKIENEAIGIIISEFGNLDELAEELGIIDFMNVTDESVKVKVSVEEAKEYIQKTVKRSYGIAVGVMLCICSPILVIILSGMQDSKEDVSDAMVSLFGVSFLLILVAVAVGLFIMNAMALQKFDYLKKEKLQLDPATEAYIRSEKENNKVGFAVKITTGVVLCILSVIPVIAIGSLNSDNDLLMCISVSVMLFIISIGVFIFVITGMEEDCYKVLLQEEEYSQSKKENKLVGIIASIYWPFMICIYLAWSFITFDWEITWIIWPIAGVLFGAIASVCNAIENKNEVSK